MSNTTNVVPFYFKHHQIRTVKSKGDDPWFVARDVCVALDIVKPDAAIRRIPESQKDTHLMSTPGGPQRVSIISEAGMYRLVLRSDKPEAEPFIDWVTSDVLPTIRKTGSYRMAMPNGGMTGDQLAEVGNAARNAAAIVKSYGYGLNRVKSRELVNTMISEATGVDVMALFKATGLLGPEGEELQRKRQADLLDRFGAQFLRADKRSSVPFRSIYRQLKLWAEDKVSLDCPLPSAKALSAWLGRAGYVRRHPGGQAVVFGCELVEEVR